MSETKPAGPRFTIDAEHALGSYANVVSIAHSYAEVILDFGRMLPGRGDIPVVSRIIMTPFQARQTLRALQHNLKMYERTYGAIPEPPSRGDGVDPDSAN